MDSWLKVDAGRSVGLVGSEGGTILLDDEHVDGARITLERDAHSIPFAITCGVYGWMVHTRFFNGETEARRDYDAMKVALSDLVSLLSQLDSKGEDDAWSSAAAECSKFIGRFP